MNPWSTAAWILGGLVTYKVVKASFVKALPAVVKKHGIVPDFDWSTFQKVSPAALNMMTSKMALAPELVKSKRDIYAVSSYEKYEDPLYLCFADFPPNTTGYDPHYKIDNVDEASKHVLYVHSSHLDAGNTGYEYLNIIPVSAEARVNAMRRKIDAANIKDEDVKFIASNPGKALVHVDAIAQSSFKNISSIVDKFQITAKDPTKIVDLSKAIGIDVSDIQKDVKTIESLIDSLGPDVSKILEQAGESVIGYIGQGIESLLGSLGLEVGAIAEDIASVAGDIASAIPFIGAAIKIIIEIMKLAGPQGDNSALCNDYINQTIKSFVDNYAPPKGQTPFPIPWHIFEYYPPDCREFEGAPYYPGAYDKIQKVPINDDRGGNLARLGQILQIRLKQFRALPIDYRVSIARWWQLSQSLMADPRVYRVFATMCKDTLGGTMASDEQVMCVAAPFAIANGFDIDGFAKLLWAFSNGFAAPDIYGPDDTAVLTTRDPNGIVACYLADPQPSEEPYYSVAVSNNNWYYTRRADLTQPAPVGMNESVLAQQVANYQDTAPSTGESGGRMVITFNDAKRAMGVDGPIYRGEWLNYCGNVIDNAWVANWAVLTMDAFELAKRIKQSNRRHHQPLTNLVDVEV